MAPLSLLMLVASEDDGGMARVAFLLARHLPAFDVAVRVVVHREAPLTRWLHDASIPYDVVPELFEIPTRHRAAGRTGLHALLASAGDLPRAVACVRDLALRHGVDILYSHNTWAHYVAVAAARDTHRDRAHRIVPVWHIHNDHSRLMTCVVDRIMARVGRVGAIAAVSHSMAYPFLGLAAPVTVIHNGIDLAAWMSGSRAPQLRAHLGLDATAIVAVYAGRLVEHKGINVLLDAARFVAANSVDVHVAVFGGTPRHAAHDVVAELSARVASWGLARRIHLMGHVERVERYVADADLALVPSVCKDGCPLSVIEALCSGIPVVGSRVGGIPEIVRDRIDGVLIPPGDARALAQAILNLARDPVRRRAMGRAAREAATRFDAAIMTERVARVLRQAVSRDLTAG